MRTASPLRYPGGKAALAGLLRDIRTLNGLGDRAVAEPFAGGSGASLTLLYQEDTHEIFINDLDPAIYDFWWTIVHRPKPFMELISNTAITIDEWHKQRNIYRSKQATSRLRRGFAAFFLNRCNRSGIIRTGGPIGGLQQQGDWKLDARFNQDNLRRRCERVAEYADRIRVSNQEGKEFIDSRDPESTFFFIDPPYFAKGPMLYLNAIEETYHTELADQLRNMTDGSWVLTYDDCPEIRKMFRGWANIRSFGLKYAASERRVGKEVLITPKWMHIPESQRSNAIAW